MKKSLFLLCLTIALCRATDSFAQVYPSDSLVLVDLYNSTGGAAWTNTWKLTNPVSTWYGINLTGLSGQYTYVAQIILKSNALAGPIPASLGSLSALRYLDLSYNALTGSIPATFDNLDLNQFCILNNNQLSGTLPAFNNAFAYTFLQNNFFTFAGLEALASSVALGPFLTYAPQGNIPVSFNAGNLSVSAGGTPSNNTYNLYRNDSLVATQVGDSIFSLAGYSSGQFYITVTNAIATRLTLQSSVYNLVVIVSTPVLSSTGNCLPAVTLSLSNAANASQIVWYNGTTAVNTVTAKSGSPIVTTYVPGSGGNYSAVVTIGSAQVTTNTVVVHALPAVSFGGTLAQQCIANTTYALTGGLPAGGIYSGPGVTGTDFDAAAAGAGTWAITYTYVDGNGCSSSATNSIVVIAAPTVGVNSASICAGGQTTLNATVSPAGSYTYVWTSSSGQILASGSSPSLPVSQPGTYTVTVTAPACSYTSSASGIVTVSPAPVVAVNSSLACSSTGLLGTTSNSATVTAVPFPSGNYTYQWSVPGGATNPGNVSNFSTNTAGTYTVTIFSPSGCSANGSGTVYALPVVTVNSPTRCAEGAASTITATVNPGPTGNTSYRYAWTVPSGAADPGNVASFPATVAGNYSVSVTTNGLPCNVVTASGTLTVTPAPVVNVNSASRCPDGTPVTLTASAFLTGSYTYAWTVPPGAANPGSVASFPATVAGTYTVTINLQDGCSTTASGVVTVSDPPTVSVNSALLCDPGLFFKGDQHVTITATPSPSGTYSYAWTVPAGVANPGNVASFPTDKLGTYSVVVTNANGCTASGEGTVSSHPNIVVNSPTRCSNGGPATITATPVPAGRYTYVWIVPEGARNPGNVASFTASVAGTYRVLVFGDIFCGLGFSSGVLTVNPPPVVSFGGTLPPQCANNTAYSLNGGSPAGGTYSGRGVTGTNFSAAAAGAGTWTITYTYADGNGCSNSATNTITVNASPAVNVNSASVCSSTPATLTATPRPAGSYTYAWTVPAGVANPGNVARFSTAAGGDYSVTATDVNGCTAVGSGIVAIGVPAVTVFPLTSCLSSGQSISANVEPAGNYLYTWSNADGQVLLTGNSSSFTPAAPGGYQVTVATLPPCMVQTSVTFSIDPEPVVSVNSPVICQNIFSGLPEGPATITATPFPAANYTYVWTVPPGAANPGSVSSFTSSTPGTYSVTIYGAGECTASGSGTATENDNCGVGADYSKLPEDSSNAYYLNGVVTPNPSVRDFSLHLQSGTSQTVQIQVFDVTGHLVYQERGEVGHIFKFGGDLAVGIYFIKVIHQKGIKVFKVIKD